MKLSNNLYKNDIFNDFYKKIDSDPHRIIAKSTDGKSLTALEFKNLVDSLAISFQREGIALGDRVLFLGKNSIESILYICAVIRVGGVLVLADPRMGNDNFIGRVSISKPKFIIVDPILNIISKNSILKKAISIFYKDLPPTDFFRDLHVIDILSIKDISNLPNTQYSEVSLDKNSEAIIIFTSGTTGTPKGVVHTHDSLFQMVSIIQSIIHINDKDIFYSSQLHFLLFALLSGTTIVIPHTINFNPKYFLSDIRKYNVTKTFGIPAEYQAIYELCKKHNLKLAKSLQLIILGSAPVLKGFLKKVNTIKCNSTKVISVYGATEVLPIAYVDIEEKLKFIGKGDLLGHIVDGIKVKIIENEIIVSGKNMFKHYLEDKQYLEYFTGDLGYILDTGLLVLNGRKKDMIIRGNHNIYPSIFESTISNIPGVMNCAMVGIYDEKVEDEKIFLFIEPEIGQNRLSLHNFLLKSLKNGEYSIDTNALPDKIVIQSLPLSGRTQKINKSILRDIARNLL